MRKTGLPGAFELWLAGNAGRFHHPPKLFRRARGGDHYTFGGVTRRVSLWVDQWQVLVRAGSYDILVDFDLSPRRTKAQRYFCGMCRPRRYYRKREALFATHSFEPLLEWANSTLIPDQRLFIGGRPRSFSVAAILPPDANPRRVEPVRFVYPLILAPRDRP